MTNKPTGGSAGEFRSRLNALIAEFGMELHDIELSCKRDHKESFMPTDTSLMGLDRYMAERTVFPYEIRVTIKAESFGEWNHWTGDNSRLSGHLRG